MRIFNLSAVELIFFVNIDIKGEIKPVQTIKIWEVSNFLKYFFPNIQFTSTSNENHIVLVEVFSRK
jgi:hypothetical protein